MTIEQPTSAKRNFQISTDRLPKGAGGQGPINSVPSKRNLPPELDFYMPQGSARKPSYREGIKSIRNGAINQLNESTSGIVKYANNSKQSNLTNGSNQSISIPDSARFNSLEPKQKQKVAQSIERTGKASNKEFQLPPA